MNPEEFKLYCLRYSNDLISVHKADGEFIYVSGNSEKINGYTAEELVGKNPYDFLHPDDIDSIRENSHELLLGGEKETRAEFRFKTKHAGYRWFEAKAIPMESNKDGVKTMISVTRDITELKQYLDEIRQKEIMIEEAGNMARIGSWELLLDTMTVNWSKVTYDIHEVEYGMMPGIDEAINFYAEEARPILAQAISNAIEKGIQYDLQLPFITAKGNRIWVRAIGRPEIKRGKTVRLYGVFQDINEEMLQRNKQNLLIDQLTRQRNQLQEYNHIVSHNLRGPVTGLSSLLHFLENAKSKEERSLLLEDIKQLTVSLNDLLEELVDAVKVINDNDLEYDEMNVKEVISNTEKLLEGNIKELGAQILLDVKEWCTVPFPKLYFESIVMNLLSNALKYSSPQRAPQIKITTGYENGKKILEFADNGLGIDMKRHRDKVFKLHKTFHRHKPGKGLGLFMTRNQVQATGGEIFVESEVDKGTVFKIIFNTTIN